MAATNSTSTSSPPTQDPPSSPGTTSRTSVTTNTPPPVPSTTLESSTPPSVTLPTSTSKPPPPPPTSESSTTSTTSTTPTTSSTSSTTPTSTTPTTTQQSTETKSTVFTTDTGNGPSTVTQITTVTNPVIPPPGVSTGPSSSATGGAAIIATENGSGGLGSSGKIAIAVVVPIAAVALLVLAGIFLWRKRKQRKDAEEERRKEVEDYTYNPNADPTVPAVAGAGYQMKEDGSSGYRGWGSTTLASSTGRKASTTMSGGAAGPAYSDAPSPTRGGLSDTRSGEQLMHDGSPPSPEGEILGAMGPSASNNRGGDVHRGLSNASSSYSGPPHSDGSGDAPIGVAYGSGAQYYDQYGNGNPYADTAVRQGGSPPETSELSGQPVIRDVTARRNTRIENPSHYPQQSVGISQNF